MGNSRDRQLVSLWRFPADKTIKFGAGWQNL